MPIVWPLINPEIFTELVLWDGKDVGGTIDMLVVYPNGSVGIYDFKTIKFKTGKLPRA
jgi:hypothetical protein